MYDCPGCQRPLSDRAIVCNACGWEPPKKRKQADEHRGTCENVERGLRCSARGVYSNSTFGTGPWYCARHYPPFYGDDRPSPKPPPEPSSLDLTDAQWYAVCKFFPTVASRAKRPMMKVGPDQPLDAVVKLNPLLANNPPVDFEAIAERDAIQRERRDG